VLAWLDGLNVEGLMLQQAADAAAMASVCAGADLFSGVSSIVQELADQLPRTAPAERAESGRALQRLRKTLAFLRQLLAAAQATVADGFLDRCGDIMEFMSKRVGAPPPFFRRPVAAGEGEEGPALRLRASPAGLRRLLTGRLCRPNRRSPHLLAPAGTTSRWWIT